VNPESQDEATPFHDLDAYVALPRVGGLVMSPDGERLVVTVATVDPDKKKKYVNALWEVDPTGHEPARRLTRGATGETSAGFTPSGDLLFSAKRPGADEDDDAPAALWLLPRRGGEARTVAERPGGIGGLVVARESGTVVLGSATLPSATDLETEKQKRKARKDSGVDAILHDSYPVRYWDHDVGPDAQRLLAAEASSLAEAAPGEDDERLDLRDLTGHVGHALSDEASWDVSADGRTVVTAWSTAESHGSERYTVVVIDVASGERRVLLDDDGFEYESPRLSPDGASVACLRWTRFTPTFAPDVDVVVVPVSGGSERVLTAGWDRWPTALRWTPDGASLVVTADSQGRAPLFRIDVTGSGGVTALTDDDWAYSDPVVSPDGQFVYALRSSYAGPAHPVRVPLDSGPAEALRSPAGVVRLPGRLTEVTATTDDGTTVRSWLALPLDASADRPAPLLLWIHGGPLSSWNAWSWRWNPWLMVARGYAVLLPDPALSTGYGRNFISRGWGAWGAAPFTDLMAATDAATRLDEVDAGRTAAMGGSFGGYMANWVAGHTDRFDAIVTHASLWAMDQFAGTTDASYYWVREMTPEMALENSPHLHADKITTPMLVIHGDKDYRVPIGEGLRLWWDLVSRSSDPEGKTDHRFLYFPSENHWVLSPGHAKVWYDTVFAFLAQHVLGEKWQQPEVLG
jgi:dipeptidyl aminopeptidase/acylaminoacyl peptidase